MRYAFQRTLFGLAWNAAFLVGERELHILKSRGLAKFECEKDALSKQFGMLEKEKYCNSGLKKWHH